MESKQRVEAEHLELEWRRGGREVARSGRGRCSNAHSALCRSHSACADVALALRWCRNQLERVHMMNVAVKL